MILCLVFILMILSSIKISILLLNTESVFGFAKITMSPVIIRQLSVKEKVPEFYNSKVISLPALFRVTHKGTNIIYTEMNEILIRIIIRSVYLRLFLSEHFHYRCVGLLPNFGQVYSFAGISFAPFDEHISGTRIGFEVLMSQTLAHNKRYGGIIDNVRLGVNGKIDDSIRIGSGQNAETLHVLEIIGQAHI